jgi:hypothetical protein
LNLSQNIRAKIRAERLRGEEFDAPLEQGFKKVGQIDKVGQGFAPRLKVYKQVHVAVSTLFPAQARTEQPNPANAKSSQISLARFQPFEKLVCSGKAHEIGIDEETYGFTN